MIAYLKTRLGAFGRNESGATAIEYGLIAALIAVVLVTALIAVGTDLEDTFEAISTDLKSATGS